jgi:hypothetical protein
MNNLTSVLLLGAGATAMTDIWGFARGPLLGVPAPDYGMVGRWCGHMAHARIHSLLMHTVFGAGLYLTGLGLRVLRTG